MDNCYLSKLYAYPNKSTQGNCIFTNSCSGITTNPPTPHHPLKKLGIGYTFIQMVVCYLAELDHEYSLMAHFSHNAAVIKEEQANTPAVPGREY